MAPRAGRVPLGDSRARSSCGTVSQFHGHVRVRRVGAGTEAHRRLVDSTLARVGGSCQHTEGGVACGTNSSEQCKNDLIWLFCMAIFDVVLANGCVWSSCNTGFLGWAELGRGEGHRGGDSTDLRRGPRKKRQGSRRAPIWLVCH